MKFVYIFIPLLITMLCLSLVAQDVDLEAEKEAIKKLCWNLTMADANEDGYAIRSLLTDEHEYLQAVSVNEFAQGSAFHRKLNPIEKPENPQKQDSLALQFENEDYVFHISGDLAWVSFKQMITEPAPGRDITWSKRINLTLRKEKSEWKVVAVGAIGTGCNDPQFFHVKQKLVDISRICIDAGDTQKGFKIAKLAVELFPKCAHCYDHLAWACYNQGDKEKTRVRPKSPGSTCKRYLDAGTLAPTNQRMGGIKVEISGRNGIVEGTRLRRMRSIRGDQYGGTLTGFRILSEFYRITNNSLAPIGKIKPVGIKQ